MAHKLPDNPVALSDVPPLSHPTRKRYVVIAFLCALAFLTYFDRVCIASASDSIERDLKLSHDQMGLILGAFWLAYGLFEIPSGYLGDRFGARKTLARIVLAWSLFTALSGAAAGFVSLLTFRFLFGVGEAGAYPNMARVQSHWFAPRVQARMGGILWLVSRWGGALSYVLFPALVLAIDSHCTRTAMAHVPGLRAFAASPSWRIAFWVCGSAGLVWVALFVPWFRDDPAEKSSVNEAELRIIRAGRTDISQHTPHFDLKTLGLLLTNPSLWAIGIAYLGSSFGWSFFVSWMNTFLRDVQHVPFKSSLWLKTGPLLCGGVACLIGGWMSDAMVRRTGRVRLARVLFPIVGSSSAAAAMFCIRYTHTPQQAVALMCIASFCTDLGQAPAWATIIGIGGAFAGTAFGFINTVANTGGNFLGPVLGGRVFPAFGWDAALTMYAAAFVLAAVMWFFVDPGRRFYTPPRVSVDEPLP